MRPQPLIAVTDVEASSRWYQRLLGCRSNHGGPAYEQLVSEGQLILQLHSFKVEHHHGPIGDRDDKPYGNGVLLWFEVDDFESVMQRATEMGVEMVMPGIGTLPMVMADRITGNAGCGTRMVMSSLSPVRTGRRMEIGIRTGLCSGNRSKGEAVIVVSD